MLEQIARQFSDDIWICAPSEEQSGAGHSLTLTRPVRLQKHGERRFAVTGTPTDSVMMALRTVMPDAPDLILSGVNRGANLGDDVTYSGTIAAAMAVARSAPAVRVRARVVSVCMVSLDLADDPSDGFSDCDSPPLPTDDKPAGRTITGAGLMITRVSRTASVRRQIALTAERPPGEGVGWQALRRPQRDRRGPPSRPVQHVQDEPCARSAQRVCPSVSVRELLHEHDDAAEPDEDAQCDELLPPPHPGPADGDVPDEPEDRDVDDRRDGESRPQLDPPQHGCEEDEQRHRRRAERRSDRRSKG